MHNSLSLTISVFKVGQVGFDIQMCFTSGDMHKYSNWYTSLYIAQRSRKFSWYIHWHQRRGCLLQQTRFLWKETMVWLDMKCLKSVWIHGTGLRNQKNLTPHYIWINLTCSANEIENDPKVTMETIYDAPKIGLPESNNYVLHYKVQCLFEWSSIRVWVKKYIGFHCHLQCFN